MLYQKCSPKSIFLNEKNNDIENWLRKFTFVTFWGPGIRSSHKIQLFPWSMFIFGQKYWFLRAPKVETP